MRLYVLTTATCDRVKVGISANVDERIKGLVREIGLQIVVMQTFDLGAFARRAEKIVHAALAEHSLGHEWFAVDPDAGLAVVRDAVKEIEDQKNLSAYDEWLLGQDVRTLNLDDALDCISTWARVSGMDESRLVLLACANARAVERVRNGTGSVESLRLLLDYIDLHPIKRAKG